MKYILLLLLLSGCAPTCKYRMNNGTVCKYKRTGQYDTYEFYKCDDGKRYIDPPMWEEVCQ